MIVRAESQKSYLWRYILMGTLLFVFAAWFAYDYWIGYPKKQEIAQEWEKLADLGEQQRSVRWEEIVKEHGWPPHKPEKTAQQIADSIVWQKYLAVGSLLLGLIPWLYYFSNRRAWIEQTNSGLKTSWGQEVEFAKVKELNKSRWKKKGIAKAAYFDANDRPRMFIFDDFKFQREPMGIMLRALEAMLNDEQITGAPREQDQGEKEPSNDAANLS